MATSGIHGKLLEATVVGCYNLKDKEWISRQDPYVCLEYGPTKFRTKTCTDGGRNPTFQEKYMFPLIEGLQELNVTVWNSNTLSADDFIGSGRILLQNVLCHGYDDTAWPIQSKNGRHSGEVRLILHCSHAAGNKAPAGQPYSTAPTPFSPLLPNNSSPAPIAAYPAAYPPTAAATYPPPPPYAHQQPSYGYPPAGYPTRELSTVAAATTPYPTQPYPPQPYPTPPQAYPPTGSYAGVYPPMPPY